MSHITTLQKEIKRPVPVLKKDTLRKLCERWNILPSELLTLNPKLEAFPKGYITGMEEVLIPWEPILLPSSFGELRHIGKYFAVPKTEEEARAIWNGRNLSALSHAPPSGGDPHFMDISKPTLIKMM